MPGKFMKQVLLSIAGIVVPSVLISCAADPPADKNNNCPPATTLPDKTGWDPGTASYSAYRDGSTITVRATGQNPTAGYHIQLAQRPEKIFPPRFALYRKPPDGVAAQVISPFSVCVTFKASTPVDAVTVYDAKGAHEVKVQATP